MTSRPPHKLYASERPVQSDYAREKSYARRRVITVIVLAVAIVFGWYVLGGRGQTTENPADIPTIKSEGAYRQKPSDPGGIDIPHQDVRVYEQIEGKSGTSSPVEHLLPPPEAPKEEAPEGGDAKGAETVAAAIAKPPAVVSPAPEPAAVPKPVALSTTVDAAPGKTDSQKASLAVVQTPPAVSTVGTATPSVPPKAPEASIESVINKVKQQNTAEQKSLPTDYEASSAGTVAIQLASVPEEEQANDLAAKLQKKYAGILGGVSLRVIKADLGAKGIYYRIQGQGVSESDAERICSSIKQTNAGCLLVRK